MQFFEVRSALMFSRIVTSSSYFIRRYYILNISTRSVWRYNKRLMEFPDCKKIFVWKDSSGETIEVQFGFTDAAGLTKQISMNRAMFGLFDATKSRMEDKLLKINQLKPSKRKKTAESVAIETDTTSSTVSDECRVTPCDRTVDYNTTNADVFYGCERIQVGTDVYTLVRDSPILDKLTIAMQPIAGCPIIPSCDWKSDIMPKNVAFHWFVADTSVAHSVSRDESTGKVSLSSWDNVFTGEIFCPAVEHVGKFLSLVVDFGEAPLMRTTSTTVVVTAVDEPLVFEERQRRFCATVLPDVDRCRIVCYNVLADLYLDLKLEQSKLFFPFCLPQHQEADYRYPLILRELAGYNADLMCLQEVDFRFQKRFLRKFLESKGFAAEFRCSSGEVNEGQMIAFRSDKFRLVESLPALGDSTQRPTATWNPHQGVRISDLADGDTFPENRDIADFLAGEPEMREYLLKKATTFQIVHLESISNSPIRLLVLNTHLTFDPAYEHIKLLQAVLCLRYLTRERRRVEREVLHAKIYALFCGDLNSTPDSGVVRLCCDGRVDASPASWGANTRGGIPLNEDVQYVSLAGFPEYTNYTKMEDGKGFAGCLDYIWCHPPPTDVEQVIPLPEHELVRKYTAIPSKIAPSDHLALVCDIKL